MNGNHARLESDLTSKRKEIDRVDRKLLDLFNRRIRLVSQAIAIKKEMGKKMRDLKREWEILDRLTSINPGPLETRELKTIFRAVMKMSRHAQRGKIKF